MWWSNALSWSVWGINMLEHHRSSAPLWWKSSLKMIHGISYDLLGLLCYYLANSRSMGRTSFWRRAPPTHFERMERHSLRLKRNVIRHTRSGLDQTYQKTTKYILPFCHCLSSAGLYLSIYIWSKKNFFGHLLANKFPAGIWKMMNEIGESVGAQHSHLGKQQFSTFDVFPTSQLDTRGNHYNVLHLVWIHLRGMLYF